MKFFVSEFNHFRARKAASFVYPNLKNKQKVLDFGCGDMLVAKNILIHRNVDLTGIDVIDIREVKDIPFQLYDGKKIPFKDKTFDVTYSAFVLHHTPDVEYFLSECIRVSKLRVILLEDVYKNKIEKWITGVFDRGNRLTSHEMNLELNFRSIDEWNTLFKKIHIKKATAISIRPDVPRPTRHRMYILDL